jgi:hypothetical protein
MYFDVPGFPEFRRNIRFLRSTFIQDFCPASTIYPKTISQQKENIFFVCGGGEGGRGRDTNRLRVRKKKRRKVLQRTIMPKGCG